MIQTEFEFTLPKGYLDDEGNLHRKGVMRLARAIDEIVPLRDPRVRSNAAYATILILSRTIVRLGALESVSPAMMENLFAVDLNYLQKFYRQINELEPPEPDIIEETQTAENREMGDAIAEFQ
jgi:hypothetical protein